MFINPRQYIFAKVEEKLVAGISSLVGKYSILVNYLWYLIKSLGVGIAFFKVIH